MCRIVGANSAHLYVQIFVLGYFNLSFYYWYKIDFYFEYNFIVFWNFWSTLFLNSCLEILFSIVKESAEFSSSSLAWLILVINFVGVVTWLLRIALLSGEIITLWMMTVSILYAIIQLMSNPQIYGKAPPSLTGIDRTLTLLRPLMCHKRTLCVVY